MRLCTGELRGTLSRLNERAFHLQRRTHFPRLSLPPARERECGLPLSLPGLIKSGDDVGAPHPSSIRKRTQCVLLSCRFSRSGFTFTSPDLCSFSGLPF